MRSASGLSSAARLLLLVVLLMIVGSDLQAGNIRSNWTEGEQRTYRFRIGDLNVGTHTATFVGVRDVDHPAAQAYLFEMTVQMDMSTFGKSLEVDLSCSLYCALNGFPLIYNADYLINGERSWIRSVVENGVFKGASEGLSPMTDFSFDIPPRTYLCDNFLLVQWEMVLSDINLTPGSTSTVDILIPQELGRYALDASVQRDQLVIAAGDTALCRVIEVEEFFGNRFYIDPDGKLLKATNLTGSLVMELIGPDDIEADEVSQTKPFWPTLPRRIILWVIYLAWSIVIVAFLARGALRTRETWVLFGITGLAAILYILARTPIQQVVSGFVFGSMGMRNQGVYIAAFLLSLLSGIFQESLKVTPLWIWWTRLVEKPRLKQMTAYGAAAGAGFGFVEVCWLTGSGLQGWLIVLPVWQSLVTIVLHASLGFLLGYGIGRRRILNYWLIVVLLHFGSRFLEVLLKQRFVDLFFYECILTIYNLIVFAIAIGFLRKLRRR